MDQNVHALAAELEAEFPNTRQGLHKAGAVGVRNGGRFNCLTADNRSLEGLVQRCCAFQDAAVCDACIRCLVCIYMLSCKFMDCVDA